MSELRIVQFVISGSNPVDCLICSCGAQTFMVFFENRRLHIYCKKCNVTHRIAMSEWGCDG